MKQWSVGTDIAMVAVFAALIAAFTLMPPLFMVGAVPFAVQIVFVLLTPLVLGPGLGSAALALYLAVGFAGLPVFAQQQSTFAVLAKPTAGYLVGYLVAAPVVGLVATLVLKRWQRGAPAIVGLVGAAVAGLLVIHACGVVGLMLNAKLGLGAAVGTTAAFRGW